MPSVVAVPTQTPDPASPLAFVRAMPGPVLLFAPDLTLAFASAPAALLEDALGRDGAAATALKQTAAEAQATKAAAQGRVELPHEDAHRVFELTAVPAAGGEIVVIARDVSFETNMRAALIESRQRYKDLVDIASDFAWETGSDGRFAFVSGGGAMGYAAEALIGTRPADLLVDPEAAVGTLPFAATGVVTESEIWLRDAAGAAVCLLATATPLTDADGNWRGARGLCRDVTRERARDAAFAQAKLRDRVVTYVIDRIRNEVEPEAMLDAAAGVLARATNADAAAIYLAESEGPMAEAARYGEPPEDTALADWLEDLAAHDPMLEQPTATPWCWPTPPPIAAASTAPSHCGGAVPRATGATTTARCWRR